MKQSPSVSGGQVALDALWNYIDTLLKSKQSNQQPEQLNRNDLQSAFEEVRNALSDLSDDVEVYADFVGESTTDQAQFQYSPSQQKIADIFWAQVAPNFSEVITSIRDERQIGLIPQLVHAFLNLSDAKQGGFFPPEIFEVINYEIIATNKRIG